MSYRPWHRTYNRLVDDERIRLLAFEDRWHNEALKCLKGQGVLDAGDGHDLMRRKVAVKLGVQLRELEEIARRLGEVGLIDPETLQPIGWGEEQFVSDADPTAKARKRKQREKEREVKDNQRLKGVTDKSRVTPPVTVMNVTRTDTDTDTDTDTNKTTTSNTLNWDALSQFSVDQRSVVVEQMKSLSPGTQQDVIDELAGAFRLGTIKKGWSGWLDGVVKKAREGRFKPDLAMVIQSEREREKGMSQQERREHLGLPPVARIASREVAEAAMAAIRSGLSTGDST